MIVQFRQLIVCSTRCNNCHLGAWEALFVRSLDMVVTASRVHTLPESGLRERCSVAGTPGLPWPPVTHTFLSMHCPHFRLQVLPMSISMCSSMCILQRMLEHIKTYGRENGNEWLCTGIRANCMSMKHIVEDLNDGTYIVMLCEVVELALIMRCHLAAWKCLCFMSVCCSVSGFVTCRLELETKVRNDFTMTEKALLGPPPD